LDFKWLIFFLTISNIVFMDYFSKTWFLGGGWGL